MSEAVLSDEPALYQWAVGRLQPMRDDALPGGDPLVADSYLLTERGAIHADRHLERFAADAADSGPFDATRCAEFVRAGWRLLAERARRRPGIAWFPRFELAETLLGPRLLLRVREAPALAHSAILATAASDPRSRPAVKGPDLSALEALRAAARQRGATEAAITDACGLVVDGATTALLWWGDDGALIRPDESLPRVASVTARALLEIARTEGVETRQERVTAENLRSSATEIWAVNALHGIRPVVGWIGESGLWAEAGAESGAESGTDPHVDPEHAAREVDEARLEHWRRALEAGRSPLN